MKNKNHPSDEIILFKGGKKNPYCPNKFNERPQWIPNRRFTSSATTIEYAFRLFDDETGSNIKTTFIYTQESDTDFTQTASILINSPIGAELNQFSSLSRHNPDRSPKSRKSSKAERER